MCQLLIGATNALQFAVLKRTSVCSPQATCVACFIPHLTSYLYTVQQIQQISICKAHMQLLSQLNGVLVSSVHLMR